MGGTNSYRNRFPLPGNWNVEDYICALVPIPNDPEYIAMFRGMLDSLTWQRSYQLHPTGNAAYQVSKTWQNALESAQIRFLECDMPTFRINPSTCLLEVNCGTDLDPSWRPVFTPDYIPGQDAPEPPSLYPDPPPPGQDNACLAAANLTAMLQNGANNISALIDGGAAFGAVLANVFTFLSQVVTLIQSQLWPDFQVAYSTWNSATIRADYLAFDWSELQNILVCHLDENGQWAGTLTIEKITSFNDALNEVQDRIPFNQIWSVIAFQMAAMGWIGTSLGVTWGGITSATCDPCGMWHQVWDFTIDAQGWVPANSDAAYVAGQGWENYNRGGSIKIAGPDRTVRYQKVVFDSVVNGGTRVIWLNYPDASLGYDDDDIGAVSEWMSGDLSGMPFVGGIWYGNQVNVGDTWGTPKIIRIEEWGDGVNPW